MCHTRYRSRESGQVRRRPSRSILPVILQLKSAWLSKGLSASVASVLPFAYQNQRRFQGKRNILTQRALVSAEERSAGAISNGDLSTQPQQLLSMVDDILLESANFLDQSAILMTIDDEHARDVEACSSLPAEIDTTIGNHIDYDRIFVGSNAESKRSIAIRTYGPNSVLDESSIQLIRSAAEAQWSNPEGGATSRFTYQRKGNYEAHLNDLASADPKVQSIVAETLLTKVYPLIRDAFGTNDVVDDIDSLRFCVYDSLVIRYNATASEVNDGMIRESRELMGSSTSRVYGAGQPLHRDLGLVSINIMLNSEDEFEGGGTVFENQFADMRSLQDLDREDSASQKYQPLKPCSPGHALSHLSNERHAGSSTIRGERDILVIFVTARRADQSSAPLLERNARLKAAARRESTNFEDQSDAALCRATYQRLAVDSVPFDGEAWHYLGMALRDYSLSVARENDNAETMQVVSLDCLRYAAQLTPCDGRVFNNIGLSLGHMYMEKGQDSDAAKIFHETCQCYEKASLLHRASELVGCDVGYEHDASVLNHGLFLANLDQFGDAVRVLSEIKGMQGLSEEDTYETISEGQRIHLRIVKDGLGLRRFCEEKAEQLKV